MLISFNLENWKSYLKASFSMIATSEKRHGERLVHAKKYRKRILPIASIYGGNASGKSTFFSAINFVKRFILDGNMPNREIEIFPFLLDEKSVQKPSEFSIVVFIDERFYEFSFCADRKRVVRERLVRFDRNKEVVLYKRENGQIVFDKEIERQDKLNVIFEGTGDNILFLTNSVFQKRDDFRYIYDWFREKLVLVAPDSRFQKFEIYMDERSPLRRSNNEIIERFDTGISKTGSVETSIETLPFYPVLVNDLAKQMQDDSVAKLSGDGFSKDKILLRKKDGKLTGLKMATFHRSLDQRDVPFEMEQESDGTLRLLDLVPMLNDLSGKSDKVYVVDEIDRSLHHLATRKIIELYLQSCTNESRSQLIFTTHDLLLMNQNIFRRDEMWIVERKNQSSNISSIGDFILRNDCNIGKAYIQGRLGGIPNIILSEL